ncbi:MAG: DUF6242 domain-containing protein [Rikenellaceae bacterium]|nr:DUF6242 domain-containing protein [Rikenellaceae bacterium]
MKKNRIPILLAGVLTLCLAACHKDGEGDDGPDEILLGGFRLRSQSIPQINGAAFTIDPQTGDICNPDSLAYGTKTEGKACCIFTTNGTDIRVRQAATGGDFLPWKPADSIDISQPVDFLITAGKRQKTYTVRINVHTVSENAIDWEQATSDLYGIGGTNLQYQGLVSVKDGAETKYVMFTADASAQTQIAFWCHPDLNRCEAIGNVTFNPDLGNVDWGQLVFFNGVLVVGTYDNLQGIAYRAAPPAYTTWTGITPNTYIHSILGVVNKSDDKKSYLAAIGKKEGKYVFMRTSDLENWETGDEVDQDNFPMGGGFARLSYENMYHPYLLLAGGSNLEGTKFLNTVWNTTDGLNWVRYESPQPPFREGMAGGCLAECDGIFYLTGGMNYAGETAKEIIRSVDHGLTWQRADESMLFPAEYAARAYSSAFVTPENELYIFSGKESAASPCLDEVWKGKITRNY